MEKLLKNLSKNAEKYKSKKNAEKVKNLQNGMFLKVFRGSAGTKFSKNRFKNHRKIALKSRSIWEVILKGFCTIWGAVLEAKIDQKTKKTEIKNKSDFKTMSYWRITAIGPNS